jgi:tetratricopeptide (TPR) repeat protein
MTTRSRTPAADRLAELARTQEPEPPSKRNLQDVVDAAMQEQALDRTQATPRKRRRAVGAAVGGLAAAAAVALAVFALDSRSANESARTEPPRAYRQSMQLDTGDRITVAEGGAYRLVRMDGTRRHIELLRGAALFDVKQKAGSFEVSAGRATVHVEGTVFSVWARGENTVVRVYEGRVRVRAGDREHRLEGGDAWSTRGKLPERAPLAAAGRKAADARKRTDHGADARSKEDSETDSRATGTEERAHARRDPRRPPLGQVRQWLEARRFERVLAAVPPKRARRDPRGAMLRADAYRGLRQFEQAVQVYDRIIARGERAAEAGYLAASVRFHRLGRPRKALQTLASSGATSPKAVFEERALAMRVRILRQLDRQKEADRTARHHRQRFGGSSASSRK